MNYFQIQLKFLEKKKRDSGRTEQLGACVHISDDVRLGVLDLVVEGVGVDAEGLVHDALRGARNTRLVCDLSKLGTKRGSGLGEHTFQCKTVT